MALDFNVKDILHRIQVRFVHAFLPEAKKPFNLKAVHQPELDIHGIASKAEVYNITTPPKVIEEGLSAGMELMYYLAADGFKLNTPVFHMHVRVPGEYDGSETHLPQGIYPTVRLQTSARFRKYLRERVQIDFCGIDSSDGFIAEAYDETSELTDEVATAGDVLAIHGFGLKIEGDGEHHEDVGLFFVPEAGGQPVKATLAVNEPRTLKAVVPTYLDTGKKYRLMVVTQSSAKGHGYLVKEVRQMRSDFVLTAQ